ncbi:MAG: hypothetical protein J6K19_03570 [Prevotella sp.]|nr:hypothetical protein [Prevotella sp.]
MESNVILKASLYYDAVYLNVKREDIDMSSAVASHVLVFAFRLKDKGYYLSEELLHALCQLDTKELECISEVISTEKGINLLLHRHLRMFNKIISTSDSARFEYWMQMLFKRKRLSRFTALPCGHNIPNGIFPLAKYHGCPFCGAQFQASDLRYRGKRGRLNELRLFTDEDIVKLYHTLLCSTALLNGVRKDCLGHLLATYPVPENIVMENNDTVLYVMRILVEQGRAGEASRCIRTPTDILRYLWYEKTGYLQIIEPKKCFQNAAREKSPGTVDDMKRQLRLKYSRKECRRVAAWLNSIPMPAAEAAEDMNPKRGMWVRMIHALRLGEYSRRKGYEHLAEILDVFYKKEYTTWQGAIDKAADADAVLKMLKERPGLFARCLFSTMLRFGAEATINAFNEISDELPLRRLQLLVYLAYSYFNPGKSRLARPVTGGRYRIPVNKHLHQYSKEERWAMVRMVGNVYRASIQRREAI